MPPTPPVVLTIAGFDPSSGAGITADIKTIAAHGCYGVACITALTVQSTAGVRRTKATDTTLVTETLEELRQDVDIAAVRIGMLGSTTVTQAVAQFLEKERLPNVVLDPVLKSSSGADLLERSAVRVLAERLLPLCTVVTPNVEEATVLAGLSVTNPDEMRAAALKLHTMGAPGVVVTGGHLNQALDLLGFVASGGEFEFETFKSEKQESSSTHGTGCAFASSLACHLALGRGLPDAVLLAKAYVAAAISNAHPLGKGIGPVHHLFRMNEQRRPERSHEPETTL